MDSRPDEEHAPASEPEGSDRLSNPDFAPDVSAFLQALARALQKHSMYPPGHPALQPAAAEAMERLEEVLRRRAVLSVGVATRQLAVEGTESDPEHPRHAFLADRLHRHRVATLTFSGGIAEDELAEFLGVVSLDPERAEGPLGALPEARRPTWAHLRVQPIRYERLGLARPDATDEMAAERSTRLWIGLARAAMVSDAVEDAFEWHPSDPLPEAEPVARAVDELSRDDAYAEAVLDRLVEIARELRFARGEEAAALRRRTSRLIALVSPEALRRVLKRGGNTAERRHLLLDASRSLEADSVVKLVQATAGAERQHISHWLLMLLSKLAKHASGGTDPVRQEAEAALREQVSELVSGWALEDAIPTDYGAVLERLSEAALYGGITEGSAGVEPERMVMMGLEVDRPGPLVQQAAARLREEHRVADLVALLDDSPPGAAAARALWGDLASPRTVRALLQEEDPDFETLDRLLEHTGPAAAGPMLDVLIESESRTVRRKLFSRLGKLGSPAAPMVIERLADDRWYVQRNMLALLGEYDEWPRKWTPATYSGHEHPAVRREAHKLMLRDPELRDMAIATLLEDRDPRSLALGLGAAQEGAPPEAVPLLIGLVGDAGLRPALRTMAIRALARVREPEALRTLLRQVRDEGGWLARLFGRWRLAEPSPTMLEALAGLYRHWSDDSQARRVLERAARSDGADVRAAARGITE